MGRRRHLAFVGQHAQEGLHLRLPHVARVAHAAVAAVPADEESRPIDVGFFGLKAIVQITDAFAQLVKQPGCMQWRDGDFAGFNIPGHPGKFLQEVLVGKREIDQSDDTLSD